LSPDGHAARDFADRSNAGTHKMRLRVPLTLTGRHYVDETQRGADLK
jgi:hypothetical protein